MSLMPALEQFASRVKQEREAGGGGQGWVGPMPQQGPSKKPRYDRQCNVVPVLCAFAPAGHCYHILH